MARKRALKRQVRKTAARKAPASKTVKRGPLKREAIKHTAIKHTAIKHKAADPLFAALETSPIGATISRVSDGVMLYANAAIERFFGLPRGRAVGLSTADFFTDPRERAQLIGLVREKGGVTRYTLPLRAAGGVPRVALVSSRLVRFRGAPAIITWIEDQSDVQRLDARYKEDARAFTAAEADAADRAAAMRRQVLAPMDRMVDLAERLLAAGAGADRHALLHAMKDARRDAIAVIDDALEASRAARI